MKTPLTCGLNVAVGFGDGLTTAGEVLDGAEGVGLAAVELVTAVPPAQPEINTRTETRKRIMILFLIFPLGEFPLWTGIFMFNIMVYVRI